MGQRRGAEPQHGTESPRVAVAQRHVGIETQIEMIMGLARRWVAIDAQAAGHAEMNQERASTELEQEILAAPLQAVHRLSG